MGALEQLERRPRVPCHRDFSPHNWLWDETRQDISIIDFEHSNPDVWLCDVVKLFLELWLDHPHLENAFWRGYGRRESPQEKQLRKQLTALDSLITLVWGLEHKEQERIERGWRALKALGFTSTS